MSRTLMTRKEATDYCREWGLELGDQQLAQLAHRNKGPVYRYLSKKVYYTKADIDNWIINAPIGRYA